MADEEQEVDASEVDMEASPSQAPGLRKTAPPPLPSTSSLPPETVAASFSAAPAAPSGSSVAPSMAPSMAPPEPAGRGPAFYGVILLVLFVLTVGAGAIVAMTRKKDAPPAPAATQAGPKVINMPMVDMTDDDAAAPASSAP